MLYVSCRLKDAGITCKSSIGSTPSCSHPVKDMAQLSEVHPGNYVFYGEYTKTLIYLIDRHSLKRKWVCFCVLDVQQSVIGSCSIEDVAVKVLTRVIGHSPHRNQLLVDCGWSALSLDGAGKLPTGYAVIEGHPELKYCSLLLFF